MEHDCPYDDCEGVIVTPRWACVEDDLKCPKCARPVEVEHECHFGDEGDSCVEWLQVPRA